MANVLILSAEEYLPYQRPPLSKELWAGADNGNDLTFINWENKKTSVFYLPDLSYEKVVPRARNLLEKPSTKVKFSGKTEVVSLDPEKHTITLNSGQVS